MTDTERTLYQMIVGTQGELADLKKAVELLTDDRDDRTVTQLEAARMLGIHPQTLANWRRAGIIRPIEGTTRYPLGEIRRVAHTNKADRHD